MQITIRKIPCFQFNPIQKIPCFQFNSENKENSFYLFSDSYIKIENDEFIFFVFKFCFHLILVTKRVFRVFEKFENRKQKIFYLIFYLLNRVSAIPIFKVRFGSCFSDLVLVPLIQCTGPKLKSTQTCIDPKNE